MTRRETGDRGGVRVMLEIKIRLTLERAWVSAFFTPFEAIYTRMGGYWRCTFILSAVYLAVYFHVQIQAKEHCEHVPNP